MGPSSTIGAVRPQSLRATTNVIVFQWPCGIGARHRCPRGARPRNRSTEAAVARLSGGLRGIVQVVVDPNQLREAAGRSKLLKFHCCIVYATQYPCRPAGNPDHRASEPKHRLVWSFRDGRSRQPRHQPRGLHQGSAGRPSAACPCHRSRRQPGHDDHNPCLHSVNTVRKYVRPCMVSLLREVLLRIAR
jgi:hypothetical protein